MPLACGFESRLRHVFPGYFHCFSLLFSLMSLLDRLTQERKLAYKEKNTPIKEVISFLLSQIQNKEIELQRSLEDSDILQLLKKEIKTRKESVAFLQDAGKMEEADDELSKIDFLAQFVPAPYSKEELRALVEKAMHTL